MLGWLSLALLVLTGLLLPTLFFVIRMAVRWTRVEAKLDVIADKLVQIVRDKDKVHAEIMSVVHEDRKATNDRLTWLERNLWRTTNKQNGGENNG